MLNLLICFCQQARRQAEPGRATIKVCRRHASKEGSLTMLVLRRKVGESIILDGVISISVLAVEGERVKIGINAPPDVTIVREELLKVLGPDHSEPAPQR